jgi:mRNA interferase RelE/StbE
MRVLFSERFARSFREAPDRIQREFGKQLAHLLRNLRHPSLFAKKYDETRGIWQARVNEGWRFLFYH